MEDATLLLSDDHTLDNWNKFYQPQLSVQVDSSVSSINDRYRHAVKRLRHTGMMVSRETPISDAMHRVQQDARGIFSCMVRYSYYNPNNAWNIAINEIREKVDDRIEFETPESMWSAVNSLYILVVREGRGIAEIMSEESTAQLNITILAFERKMLRACSQLLKDSNAWGLYVPSAHTTVPRRVIPEVCYDDDDEILT
jgi:hypothetical protein